jgi:hypothetical protein
MKKLYSITALLFLASASQAQTFWTEDFGTGCNRGQLASAYTGTNGTWTITGTGTNGNVANTWYVSSASAGTGAGNCASSCVTASTNSPTLHVSNVAIVIPSFLTVGADTGASYFSGGFSSFGYTAGTSRRVESPTINCVSKINITATFVYLENGDASTDDGQFVCSTDGGTTWSVVDVLAKTTGSCGADGQWTSITLALPAAADNNPMVKIGFSWVNNDDGVGSDPSFSVDDITLASNPLGIAGFDASSINVFSKGNGQIRIDANGYGYKTIGVYNMLGEETKFTAADNSIQLNNAPAGIYLVTLEVNGVRVTRKVMMN